MDKLPLPPLEERIRLGLDHNGKPKRRIKTTIQTAENWWIEMSRESVYHFIWYVTGFKPANHHKIWLANMFHPTRTRINLIAPRESAKTTITVYSLAWLMAKYPLSTFGVIGVSAKVARDRLAMLRQLIGYNLRFQNVFPNIKIDSRKPDTQDEFSIWDDNDSRTYAHWRSAIQMTGSMLDKNPSIFAAGVTGAGIIGRRISGVFLFDDMVDRNYLTVEMQDKVMETIIQVLEPCVTEAGRIWNIGTRWMIEDIYERIANNGEWTTISIPAILYDENHEPHSYWPEFWPLPKLEKKRKTMNDDLLFRIMYLCDPTAVTGALFTPEQLNRDLPEILPEFAQIWLVCDTATSLNTHADWNVVYVIGIDYHQNIYILEGMRYKDEAEDSAAKMSQLWSFAKIFGPPMGLIMEVVNAETVFRQFLEKLHPQINVIEHRPKGDKMQRAKQVSYYARQGRIFINQNLGFIKQLHTEWANFPAARHDDTLDPIGLLLQYLNLDSIAAECIVVKRSHDYLDVLKERKKARDERRAKLKRHSFSQ